MLFRAERLLEEYAEAKLAMMNSVGSLDDTSEDDDGDDYDAYSGRDTTAHRCSSIVNSHAPRRQNLSTNISSNPGRKTRAASGNSGCHQKNPASSTRGALAVHQQARGSSTSRDNPAASERENPASWRENRGAKMAVKHLREGRSALGAINHESNLIILGQNMLPTVPTKYVHYPRGYLGS